MFLAVFKRDYSHIPQDRVIMTWVVCAVVPQFFFIAYVHRKFMLLSKDKRINSGLISSILGFLARIKELKRQFDESLLQGYGH
ncbi:hypothetical protein VB735_22455 [Halotia wernerae UHCC 0503]|nr:hypothetical protein [Halotia wernerae UHCC 0503]